MSALNLISRRPRRVALAITIPAIALPLLAVAPASASGRPGVRAAGHCSGPSHWKLSAKPDDGRIQVEAEVDTPANGRAWAWKLADNGHQFAAGQSVTKAPSGSFSVERNVSNHVGTDRIALNARSLKTGETCVGSVSLG